MRMGEEQPKNVECFNYLSSMITNKARRTMEIKPRIGTTRRHFSPAKWIYI
jgi:hypothetical protein